MKKIFVFSLLIFTILYANKEKSIAKDSQSSIIGIYEPTKRKCADYKTPNLHCKEAISQFEFIRGGKFSGGGYSGLEFVVWSPRLHKKNESVDKSVLVANTVYIASYLNDIIKENETIILEDDNENNYIAKVQFLDPNKGIYTYGYKNHLSIIYFKRISKEEDKYIRSYPKK